MDELILKMIEEAPGWIVAIGLLLLALRALLPASKSLNEAHQSMITQQQSISKNLEDIYEKKLSVSSELIEQRLITVGMQRDRERDTEIAKLRQEITALVTGREIDHGKIDVLEKKSTILDENNLAKDEQIKNLLAQVAQIPILQGRLDAITEERNSLIERITGLESRIATLIGIPLPPPETSVASA